MKLLTLAAVLLVAAHIPMAGSDPIYEPILPDPSPVLHCIQCQSWKQPLCADPEYYDENATLQKHVLLIRPYEVEEERVRRHLKPCAKNAKGKDAILCRKDSMVTEDKKYSVVRDCGYTILMNISMRRIDPDGNRCYKRDQDNIDHVVCNCFGDGCNGAEEIDLSFLLLLLPCLTLFLNVFPLEWRVSI